MMDESFLNSACLNAFKLTKVGAIRCFSYFSRSKDHRAVVS